MIKKLLFFVGVMPFMLNAADTDLAKITNKTSREIILKSIETGQATGKCNAGIITDKKLAPGATYDVDISGSMCRIRRVTFAYATGGGKEYVANMQKFPVVTSQDFKFMDPKGDYSIIDCGNDSFSLVADITKVVDGQAQGLTCGITYPIHRFYKSEGDAKDSIESIQDAIRLSTKDAIENAKKQQ